MLQQPPSMRPTFQGSSAMGSAAQTNVAGFWKTPEIQCDKITRDIMRDQKRPRDKKEVIMRYNPNWRSAGYSVLGALLLLAITAASVLASPTDQVNPLTKRFLVGKGLDICD